ncbi:hypothetical protein [Pontibacter sp. H249]|uniref:hypothetical protein n=1 Tax=Pontibacter sp. H249 TaxID=3133420 RepID=UPI0030BCB6C1
MKKMIIKTSACLALTLGSYFTANSQSMEAAKEPYWVTETNAKLKNYTIVRFYNTQHQLVYEERLDGVHLDATRKRTKRMLSKALQGVMQNNILASQYFRSHQPKKRIAST